MFTRGAVEPKIAISVQVTAVWVQKWERPSDPELDKACEHAWEWMRGQLRGEKSKGLFIG